jgi:hypothetical protein
MAIGRQIQSGHLAIHSGDLVYHGLQFVGLVRGNAMLIAPGRNSFKGAVARCPYLPDFDDPSPFGIAPEKRGDAKRER